MYFSNFDFEEIKIIVSARRDGPMKIKNERDAETIENREKFLRENGINPENMVSAGLIHGNNVVPAGREDGGKFASEADGLITGEKGLFLSVTVADCLPIFLADTKKRFVGILHCGWRGLAGGIIENGVKLIRRGFNADPREIIAGIGPGIGVCHYEVMEDVMSAFRARFPSGIMAKIVQGNRLDLKGIAEHQLLSAGVPDENIEIDSDCTFCRSDIYYSYRRDTPESVEAMMAAVGML